MARKRNPNDFTVEELRRMLIDKRRTARQARIERYRKSGRAVLLAPDVEPQTLETLRTSVPEEAPGPPRRRLSSVLRMLFDRALLLVEIAAVLVLVFVVFNGFELLRELNQEVSIALEQPTITATPLVSVVVLPSGHTPPTDPGGARPNEAEIPEHLRPLVQSLAAVPLPTPSPEQATRIQIPALDIDAPVVMGDGWEQLKKGVGQHIGTPNPGQQGNLVLSAHNDIFGEIFRYLDQLKPGDEVVIYTNLRVYTYAVTVTKIVEPTQVEVMAPTESSTATLISCYPYLVDNQRIVVQAILQDG